MSGPKVSIYQLEPYIRENILKQMRLKRRCLSLFGQINDRIISLEALSEKCENYLKVYQSTEGSPDGIQTGQRIQEAVQQIKKRRLAELKDAGPIEKMPEKYRYSPEIVRQDSAKVHMLEENLRAWEQACRDFQKQILQMTETYPISHEKAAKDAAKAVGQLGRFDFNDIAVQKIKQDWRRRDAAAAKLKEIAKEPGLSAGLRERAGEAAQRLLYMEDEHMADNYISIAASGIYQEAERERSRRQEEIREFQSRIRDYHAICAETGSTPEEISFTEDWREKIGEAVYRLEASADGMRERGYISDCLDSVMAEMGYQVIGYRDVKKKSGKRFHSSLYSYGDGRAIQVTQSDDGQITMELGGLDYCDRMPESREAEALEADMYSFCDSFAEIESRLRKKGVLMTDRISKPAPAQEYATIINLNDFVLTTEQALGTIEAEDDAAVTG